MKCSRTKRIILLSLFLVAILWGGGVLAQEETYVIAHDDIFALIDPCLAAGSRFLDAQLGHTGINGFGHSADFFNFINNLGGFTNNPIRQGFKIIGTCQWIDHLTNL